MERQKNLEKPKHLEKEERNWRNQPAWLQTILQSYSHQDSMVLAQRKKNIEDPAVIYVGECFAYVLL